MCVLCWVVALVIMMIRKSYLYVCVLCWVVAAGRMCDGSIPTARICESLRCRYWSSYGRFVSCLELEILFLSHFPWPIVKWSYMNGSVVVLIDWSIVIINPLSHFSIINMLCDANHSFESFSDWCDLTNIKSTIHVRPQPFHSTRPSSLVDNDDVITW